MNYEALISEAEADGLIIKEKPLKYSDGRIKGRRIAIRQDVSTSVQKACILAEELGHYYTSSGNILDQSSTANRKQELRARAWAYQKCLDLGDLIKSFKYGCRNRYEIAEYLNVTEEFLQEGINYFKGKYGPYVKYGNYTVYFEPLGALELL